MKAVFVSLVFLSIFAALGFYTFYLPRQEAIKRSMDMISFIELPSSDKIYEEDKSSDIYYRFNKVYLYKTNIKSIDLERTMGAYPVELVTEGEMAITNAFTHINFSNSGVKILFNGSDLVHERPAEVTKLNGRFWKFKYPDGRLLTVEHYPMSQMGQGLEINNDSFDENLVFVFAQYRP